MDRRLDRESLPSGWSAWYTSLAAGEPVEFLSRGRQLSLNEAQLNVLGAVVVDVGRSSEDTKYLWQTTLLSKFALQMRTLTTISLRANTLTLLSPAPLRCVTS